MILVKHYVGQSRISGSGLFTAEPVRKGQVVYEFDYRFVQLIADSEIEAMPEPMREAVYKYSYRGKGKDRLQGAVYYCADDSRFMNHEDSPSTLWIESDSVYVAARDLPADSELTCNYSDFCDDGDMCFRL
ncbi:SET domain-containing protein [Rhodanobacter sp. DHB23]|uniref:SET domain-containing protein n=1 Tax=Rhodanobacter sp. DHB23 TaxID=2775923 RepID=UPI00177C9276|nr:SET domain-containing protein [Rhodanobacter sp. DHB23]MBD8872007.1 SET domain-containing protein [Rhodanobacter sp. DHB23]